ncbi:MAG: DEAD/DEAH box helicase family protein [Prevotella sp.]|nr:DEAD/DEAH box helicase family protein [Alistipes senegalensis]MCM1357044.1 DEAD/DEAH box helicase family protein [Prevotella sp.]MCM1473240.1 DEAD/DEAH box helicase family protein [Muribaculaceae bacterium]
MALRAYQEALVQKVHDTFRRGIKSACIVLPCGGGKSVIVSEIAKRTTEKLNHVLFLVHRIELCEQIERTFRAWGVDLAFCSIMMVQTACRRLKKIPAPVLIITDESHHSKSESYRKIYDFFPEAYRIGVTATPVRLDGSGLGDVYQTLIEGVSAKWLIENNFLSPYTYYAPTVADLNGIKIQHGEFETKSAENVLFNRTVFGNVISHYRKLADGKQAICYCVSIKHSEAMAEEFQTNGISAVHIDGTTPKAERQRIIEDFRNGKIKILCNVDLISEGFDVPDCECAILLRPTKSLTLYIQQSMRCMRYKPRKSAIIIDHVGNYARFGMPDADRQWTLESKSKKAHNQAENQVKVIQCPECFYTFQPEDDVKICPECGYAFPKKERTLDIEDSTELRNVTGFMLKYDDSPDQCRNIHDLQKYAKNHGYKSGWCWYQARQRGWIK